MRMSLALSYISHCPSFLLPFFVGQFIADSDRDLGHERNNVSMREGAPGDPEHMAKHLSQTKHFKRCFVKLLLPGLRSHDRVRMFEQCVSARIVFPPHVFIQVWLILLAKLGPGVGHHERWMHAYAKTIAQFERSFEIIEGILTGAKHVKNGNVDPVIPDRPHCRLAVDADLAVGMVRFQTSVRHGVPPYPCREHAALLERREQIYGALLRAGPPDVLIAVDVHLFRDGGNVAHHMLNGAEPYLPSPERLNRAKRAIVGTAPGSIDDAELMFAFPLEKAVERRREVIQLKPVALVERFHLACAEITQDLGPDRFGLADHHRVPV